MELEPQSRAVVAAINASGVLPFSRFEPIEARAQLLKLRAAPPAEPRFKMWKVSEEQVTTADGSFNVRILEPRPPAAGHLMPAVIYFHGGGFFAGGLDETDPIVRQIAIQADVIVVNVNYHLAPEFKFPVPVNDAYAALLWLVENAQRLGVDPERIMLAGDSAGGNLTIVTCLQVRERGGPKIRFQVPIYPSLDLRTAPQYGSRLQWGGGDYVLGIDDIAWMLKHYCGDPSQGNDWRASPILAKSYAGLPPALVVTASHDPLRDEGKLYADRLEADGVAAEYARFEGTFHGFVGFAAAIAIGAEAMDLICARIRRAGWD